jgi:FHA domain
MQSQLTLTYYDDAGRLTRVNVASRRFTIGRDPENDLVIKRTGLSRRQALIESFDNTLQISDCGSSNGTFVNGNRVEFPIELRDGDVIDLGGVCEVEVQLDNGRATAPAETSWANESVPLSHEGLRAIDRGLAAQAPGGSRSTAADKPKAVASENSSLFDGLGLHIIVPVVAVMILALVAVVIALKGSGNKKQEVFDRGARIHSETPVVSPLPSPLESMTVIAQPRTEIEDELDEVEKDTLAVMRAISLRDPNPVLTQQNDKEIYEKIKTYKGSATLRDNLRLMKSRGIPQLAGAAKARGVRLPLLVFAALARVDKDGHGDPVAVAGELIPNLARNQVFLAKDLAQDNLLALAATDPSSGGGMALRDAIAELTKKRRDQGVQSIRNVWYLRDNGTIRPPAFDLVLRFLAIGAIAQNPRHFGIEAEPIILTPE